MDLEKLKNAWASMDERLGKQELIKENIIRKMIRDRSDKSLGRLLNVEIYSTALCVFVMPVIIFLNNFKPFHTLTQWAGKVFIYVLFASTVVWFIWELVKIANLMKIDFTKSVQTNILLVNRYNIWIGKEKRVSVVVTFVMSLMGIWLYAILHASAFLWTFLACLLLFSIFITYYAYKNIYDRNIASIQQSLEELKELEET